MAFMWSRGTITLVTQGIRRKFWVDSFAAYAYSCRSGTCKFSVVFLAKKQKKIPTR